jgi:hypothetical protein
MSIDQNYERDHSKVEAIVNKMLLSLPCEELVYNINKFGTYGFQQEWSLD